MNNWRPEFIMYPKSGEGLSVGKYGIWTTPRVSVIQLSRSQQDYKRRSEWRVGREVRAVVLRNQTIRYLLKF